MESKGWKYIIDLHTQNVGEEVASLDSESESENEDDGKKRMEPDEEGVLRLEGGSNDDDLDSLNNLFHWQIEDYELFLSCNMLRVDEGEKKEENECPKEHKEMEETKVITAEAKGRKRNDSTVLYMVNGPCGKIRLHCMDRCRQQGKHILQSAQETKQKGLMKTLVVQSEDSKIKNTTIDGKEWQPT